MKQICRTLDIVFARDTESNKYFVLLGCDSSAAAEMNFEEKQEYADPLEAWSNYVKAVDLLLKKGGRKST